ncbi:TetR/AcrR family transcriptional regulator [Nocardia yamanashiensis]|uniref:TetR/AcrR family transcriptional regulator n=1 Tax=Nocardia yamanashiensis TaxID=209247 RepID=UPI00082FC2D5|nr:TetR/AcrR family transcriptional regulator [Nocardia yamanashiensis]
MQQDTADHTALAGRRERNKLRNRSRIYEAAIELFVEKGYDRTTIDDITVRADVARGTFFNYFQRKEDLITEWATNRRRIMIKRLQLPLSIETTDTATLLQLCLGILAQVNEEQREQVDVMITAWVKVGRPLSEEPHTAEVFASIVRAGQERGEINQDADPETLGNVIRDLYLGALYRWIRQNSPRGELIQDLRNIIQVLLNGITVTNR